ncbi:hypothetical protein [Acinetobacter larvae]|uniref:Uncharacterized protein n=1 Tax=Acinetobacter larvae TaxID=1789224 RepID=A0A1B2M1U9_9GAMM|nr:hypothetical protein [Acinetobacter larvae]AOA59165.1 hypothetical protein BFG52_12925 [Acinetobacter larvae]
MLIQMLLSLPSPAGNPTQLHHFAQSLTSFDITLEDTDELLDIATDTAFYFGVDAEYFAMHYALYALGGLKYVEACPEILSFLHQVNLQDDEWSSSYVFIFEMMGVRTVPYLLQACRTMPLENIFILTESLGKLALKYPDFRSEILLVFDEILERSQLESASSTVSMMLSPETAVLIGWLDMKATERIEKIRQLLQHNQVQAFVGKLEDIEYELGLRNKPAFRTIHQFIHENPQNPQY